MSHNLQHICNTFDVDLVIVWKKAEYEYTAVQICAAQFGISEKANSIDPIPKEER
jgi:hypothetical protein